MPLVPLDEPAQAQPQQPTGGLQPLDDGASGGKLQPLDPPTPVPGVLPKYQGYVDKYSKQYGLDPKALSNIIGIESAGGRDMHDSSTGAKGIGQILPGTAKGLGVDPSNPEQGVAGAAHYYANLVKEFGGDKTLAAAAYNAGPGVVHGWLEGKNPLPQETINYMSRFAAANMNGKTGVSDAAVAEQTSPNPGMDHTAKLATDRPAGSNPFGNELSLDFSKAVQSVNNQLNNVGTTANAAGKAVNKNAYHPANKTWLDLKHALSDIADHPLQTFVNVESTLMRGVEQIHVDESNKEAALVEAYKEAGKAYELDQVQKQATISAAADYFRVPGNISRVLHAMKDPAEAQVLTDTLERNWAQELNLPGPQHWGTFQKIGADIATEAGHDPFSFIGLGEATAALRTSTSLLAGAHLGVGISYPMAAAMKAAAGGLTAKATGQLNKMVPAIPQAINAVIHTSAKFSNVAKKFGYMVSAIRPDLDKHFATDQNKAAFLGLSEHVDHVISGIQDDARTVMEKNAGMKSAAAADPLPQDAMQHRLRLAYKYGSKTDARRIYSVDRKGNVSGLGKLYGYVPSAADQMQGANSLGYVTYGKNLIPRMTLQAIPKNASPQLKSAFDFFAGKPDFMRIARGVTNPNDTWADSIADLHAVTGHTQMDLFKHSAMIEQDAIREGMLVKQATKMALSVPNFLSPEAHAIIGKGITPQLLQDPAKLQKYIEKETKNYFSTQVGLRPPTVIGGGKNQALKTVLGGLDAVSKLWKTSLTGTGLIVHAMRNVGIVAMMMSGSPYVASKGLIRGFKGIPSALADRMKAGGSYSTYWHETPEILKNLGGRMALGGAIGGAAGNAQAGPQANPLQRIGDIAGGVAVGAGFGAAIPAMAKMMDKMENGIRSAYLEHLDNVLGKPDIRTPEGAIAEYARHAKVTKDLGGYKNTSLLVQFMQGIGGTFVAYRLGTVPRAFADTIKNRPGIIANSERAVQQAGSALPPNRGTHNPAKQPVELHALGPMDEGIEEAADVISGGHEGIFTSPATLGPIPGGIVRSAESKQYDRTHPTSLGQDISNAGYNLAGMAPGGAAIQSLTPGLSPYKDVTGLPYWAQEMLHLTAIYGKRTSRYTASEIRHGYLKALNK